MRMTTKVFTYGILMDSECMRSFVPNAICLGRYTLNGFQLKERRFLTVTPCKDASVVGVLWEVSNDDIVNLDKLEGYPDNYIKYFKNGILFYVMRDTSTHYIYRDLTDKEIERIRPPKMYMQVVYNGLRENGITLEEFENNLKEVESMTTLTRNHVLCLAYLSEHGTSDWSTMETFESGYYSLETIIDLVNMSYVYEDKDGDWTITTMGGTYLDITNPNWEEWKLGYSNSDHTTIDVNTPNMFIKETYIMGGSEINFELQSTLPCATTLPIPVDRIDLDTLSVEKLSSYKYQNGIYRITYSPKPNVAYNMRPFDSAYLSDFAFETKEQALRFKKDLSMLIVAYLGGSLQSVNNLIAESYTNAVAI